MRVNENRSGRATTPDFLQHFAIGHLRETVPAVFLRRGQSQHADASEAINHAARNVRLPIDLRGIEICIEKSPKVAQSIVQYGLFLRGNPRIRHHPIRHELSLEKSFRKPERLRPRKKQFLSLLNLLLSLRVEFIHSIKAGDEF